MRGGQWEGVGTEAMRQLAEVLAVTTWHEPDLMTKAVEAWLRAQDRLHDSRHTVSRARRRSTQMVGGN